MSFGSHIQKEWNLLRRDPAGLIVAFVLPFIIVTAHTLTGSDKQTSGALAAQALVLSLAIWLGATTLASGAIPLERQSGTLTRLNRANVSGWKIAASKFLILGTVSILQALIIAISSVLLLHWPADEAFTTRLLPMVVLALMGTATGLAIASWLKTPLQIGPALTATGVLSVILSGFVVPHQELALVGSIAPGFPFSLGYEGLFQALSGNNMAPLAILLGLAECAAAIVAAGLGLRRQ